MGVVSIRAMKRAGGTAMEKGSKDSNDGYATVVGGAFVGIVVVVSMVPEPVWIALGIVAAFAALIGASYWAMSEYEKALAAAQDRANTQQAAQAAAAKQQREEDARKAKQRRIETLGAKNAALVVSAGAAVKQVVASEAARAGNMSDEFA